MSVSDTCVEEIRHAWCGVTGLATHLQRGVVSEGPDEAGGDLVGEQADDVTDGEHVARQVHPGAISQRPRRSVEARKVGGGGGTGLDLLLEGLEVGATLAHDEPVLVALPVKANKEIDDERQDEKARHHYQRRLCAAQVDRLRDSSGDNQDRGNDRRD